MTAFSLERRSLPDSLRYLAGKLADGQENTGPVMFTLLALADEMEAPGHAATGDLMYLAICLKCTPILPQPFFTQDERDEWTKAHEDATGHGVVYGTVAPGGKVVAR